LIDKLKNRFPNAEKYFFDSIQGYIDNEPDLPYAKTVYYLVSLIQLTERYRSEDGFALLGNLASHTMTILQDYADFADVKINYDKINFQYQLQKLDGKEAARQYEKIAKKILQVIDLDSPEKIEKFAVYNLEFVNIFMNCVNLE